MTSSSKEDKFSPKKWKSYSSIEINEFINKYRQEYNDLEVLINNSEENKNKIRRTVSLISFLDLVNNKEKEVFFDEKYNRLKDYLDRNFIPQLCNDFVARYAEFFLGNTLLGVLSTNPRNFRFGYF